MAAASGGKACHAMKLLYTSLNLTEIGLLRGLLESHGIKCTVRNEMLSTLAGEVPFTECAPQLWVRSDGDLPRARDILEDFNREPDAPQRPWTCPDCGEQVDGQFAACWNCGRCIDAVE